MQFFRRAATPDLPQSFGYKMCWVAVRSNDNQAVARALGIKGTKESASKQGMKLMEDSSLFVTSPLNGWVLAAGIPLAPTEDIPGFVKPLVEDLSRPFGEAQYYCTHRVVEMHVWARAANGRLVRGFAYVGEQGETPWNEGDVTREEPGNMTIPDEADVMRLAGAWSIDPTTIEVEFRAPSLGLIGKSAR